VLAWLERPRASWPASIQVQTMGKDGQIGPHRIEVSIPVLAWAVGRSGAPFSVEEKLPIVSKWLSGESKPTLRQLEHLARVTATPLGYFFLPEPPEEQLPVPYFRTHEQQTPPPPSTELIDTIQTMCRRQDWMREYLLDEGAEPLPFVRSARPSESIRTVASSIRNALGLDTKWARAYGSWTAALLGLRRRMEDIGIVVVINSIVGNNTHRGLDPQEFRGFVLVDEYAPLVFVNGADAKAAQMFTLAHELAHLWFGQSAIFDLRGLEPSGEMIERICNLVAAEFLVPEGELRDTWPTLREDDNRFLELARLFRVSELVAARRALDLSLIGRAEFFDFYRAYYRALEAEKQEKKASDDDWGNFYQTQGQRIGRLFASCVLRAVRQDKLLYRDAYKLTGLTGMTFEKYMNSLPSGGQA